VLGGLAAALPADGFLVLGEGESPLGLTDAYRPISGRGDLFARNPAHRVAA